MHDIGKLAVSDTILLKRGKLTPEQWEKMRSHTTVGHQLLAGSHSDVLSLAAEIALSHHEWWDGGGYPSGLQGEQIPLSGRIVALADVFDSLCHERPYKQAWSVEEAAAGIQLLSGTQFDPAVVEAFNQLDAYKLAEGAATGLPAQLAQESFGDRETPAVGAARPGSSATKATGKAANGANDTGTDGNQGALVGGADRYRRLVENSNDLIMTFDLGGMVTAANPAVEQMLGFSPAEMVGTNAIEYVAPGERGRAGTVFARIAASAGHVREEIEHVARDGRRVFLEVAVFPIKQDGQIIGMEGIARDVTERRAFQDALAYQSLHDPLTGLPNRTLLDDRLSHALALAERHSSTVALMLLDLDNFKSVNDSFGHGVGDDVLVAVATRLAQELRDSDCVMRLGGDEFVVIVEDAKAETELAALATRTLAALAEPLPVDDRVGQITASLGIALSQPGDDPASLLRHADIAMYQAKADHPGGFNFYHPKTPEIPQTYDTRPRQAFRR